ncbi:hypothetical protein F2Q68_00021997 [Brassica cretica]|uniref:Clp R domain-containing protein n=1 Tax=Brassica cretica TaxID=69181 RepID=A0A8S9FXX2_BRACR|nr:hypothetical protein F2Q68_00021997 [Brassica cretica]
MRAGLSTIQQTLTPEAATVLNQSISEAARRNHGQTTPLHVAATLLASSSGFLRRAFGLNFRPGGGGPMTRNTYLNPRLQQNGPASVQQTGVINKSDDVERVMDILGRGKKKNPVLVGDSEPGRVIKEILKRIESGEAAVKNSKVVHFEEIGSDKEERIKKLDGLLETRINTSDPGGVILNLGDLKWLVEQPQPMAVEVGRTVVAELRRLLEKFQGRLWFIGTATCETYLRCQVYHPSMENDWDLQAVSVAAKAPASGVFPRLANSLGSFTPLKSFVPGNMTTSKCCPECSKSCERELSETDWLSSGVEERLTKPKKEHGSGLTFDLNQAADTADDGSNNTCELTDNNDQEEFSGKLSLQCVPFAFHELVSRVDDAVAFRAVDFGAVRQRVSETLSERFATVVGESLSVEVEEDVLQRILSGVWLGEMELEEWIQKAIVPVLSQLKARVSSSGTYGDRTVARLELDEDSGERSGGDFLPTSVTLAA